MVGKVPVPGEEESPKGASVVPSAPQPREALWSLPSSQCPALYRELPASLCPDGHCPRPPPRCTPPEVGACVPITDTVKPGLGLTARRPLLTYAVGRQPIVRFLKLSSFHLLRGGENQNPLEKRGAGGHQGGVGGGVPGPGAPGHHHLGRMCPALGGRQHLARGGGAVVMQKHSAGQRPPAPRGLGSFRK